MGIKLPGPKNGAGLIPIVLCFVFAIAIIVAGYYHGNMHLITVLKNAGFLN
jgi:hypothetical protein